METITLAALENAIANMVNYGCGAWDAFHTLATRYIVDGAELHSLPSCVKRSVVANAKAIQQERESAKHATILAALAKPIPLALATDAIHVGANENTSKCSCSGRDGRCICGPQEKGATKAEQGTQTVFPHVDTETFQGTFVPCELERAKVRKLGNCFYGETLYIHHGNRRYLAGDTRKGTGERETPLTKEERKARLLWERNNPYLDGNSVRLRPVSLTRAVRTEEKLSAKKPLDTKGNYKSSGKATCEPLFLAGEKEQDGFSRTIAYRYLSKRVVFAPRSRATGTQDAPETQKGHGSSSAHIVPFFGACDIEDMIQEGYLLYHVARLLTQDAGTLTQGQRMQLDNMTKRELRRVTRISRVLRGNRLADTCYCVREAKAKLIWERRKNANKLNVLAQRIASRETQERSILNRQYDDSLASLLTVAREHGTHSSKELATALGIPQSTLSERLTAIREKTEQAERKSVARRAERIADVYASHLDVPSVRLTDAGRIIGV